MSHLLVSRGLLHTSYASVLILRCAVIASSALSLCALHSSHAWYVNCWQREGGCYILAAACV